MPRPWSSKASSQHHTTTDSWLLVWCPGGCVSVMPEVTDLVFLIVPPFSSIHRTLFFIVFAQSLFLMVESRTPDLIWSDWVLTYQSGFCSDLLDELLMCSWRNFGRPATSGKTHYRSKFSPFGDNGPHCGSLESRNLANGWLSPFQTEILITA